MNWYEDRIHKMEELDELYALKQEQDLFESMNRLGIVKKGGNDNATIPMDDDSAGAAGKHDQRSRNR